MPAELSAAAEKGGHLAVLKALRARLIESMDDASPGVIPQYAKQISDLSREIAELEPIREEPSDVDGFIEEVRAAIPRALGTN